MAFDSKTLMTYAWMAQAAYRISKRCQQKVSGLAFCLIPR